MDKNNDIQVNKVDKWCEGVADVSLWQAKKSVDMFLCGYSSMLSIEALDAVRTIYVYLDEALDHFNELEAKYQKQCGMISEYEEENRNLKSELYEVKKERDAYKCELANVLQNMENKFHVERVHLETAYGDRADNIISEVNAEILNIRAERDMMYAKKDDAIRKMTQEVTELEKEKIDLEDRLVQQKRLEVRARVNASTASTYRSEIKQVIDLAKSYGLIIYDDRKDAIPDDVVNIGMCGHYYVLGGRNKEESKDIQKLEKKIEALEKENKDLKYTIDRNEDFGKYVGKCVADSIQEGWKYGAYELHPYTRIDIRVEETKNTSMSFKRYSIPNIVVLFNNTQTEMERDTAQHECKELNRKIKELKRENKSLRRTVRFLDEGGSYEFYSCPVARECENFKPKVHHSYDPLDDLPDVEHS